MHVFLLLLAYLFLLLLFLSVKMSNVKLQSCRGEAYAKTELLGSTILFLETFASLSPDASGIHPVS